MLIVCMVVFGLILLIMLSVSVIVCVVICDVGNCMVVSVGWNWCVSWILVMLIIDRLVGMCSLRLVVVCIVLIVIRLLVVNSVVRLGFLCNSVVVFL